MKDSIKTRYNAFKLASKSYNPNDQISFTEYSPIYLASTSNVKDTMKLYKDCDSVLSVGATGAHGYEAALNGATKIDLFDVNELQRLYYEYMNTCIMHLSYEDFIKHFTLKKQETIMPVQELADLLSAELYYKVRFFIDEEVDFVFGPLFEFSNPQLILSSLFRYEHPITLDYLKQNVSFYNEEDYYRLQSILRSGKCKINYYQSSLSNVPYMFQDKYDLIVLDNILQYYQSIPGLDTPFKVNMFIDKKLSNLLNDNGLIQASYGFEEATEAFKKGLGLEYEKNKFNSSLYGKFILEQDIKQGINSQLIKKWDHYSYDFIRGVETFDGKNSENVVLTYRKKVRN